MNGRDLYDVLWYLSDPRWPQPNLPLLNAALGQTRWTGPEITSLNWQEVIASAVVKMDWDKARADVLPFLERSEDIEQLTLANLTKLLRREI